MLLGWVCEGQLADSYQEFFITSDESSQIDKLWRSKYSIRKAMLPKFISPELAQKVLLVECGLGIENWAYNYYKIGRVNN